MKTITINYEGKKYTLEYTREAIKQFESMGYSINDLGQKVYTIRIPLIYCGLKANHAAITMKKAEDIYNSLNRRDKFMEMLVDMIVDTYTVLTGENAEGNSDWEANWSDEK